MDSGIAREPGTIPPDSLARGDASAECLPTDAPAQSLRWHSLGRHFAAAGLLASCTLLLVSGLTKISHTDLFSNAIESQGVFRGQVAVIIATVFPGLELAAAVLALIGLLFGQRRLATLPLLILLSALAGYATLVAIRGTPGPAACGCGVRGSDFAAPANWTVLSLRTIVWLVTILACERFAFTTTVRSATVRQTPQPAIG